MRAADVVRTAAESLARHGLRTVLTAVAVAIGAVAVLALTALGEAAERYVIDRFAAMGAQLLVVSPGRTETEGIAGMAMTGAERDLTIEDAEAVRRRAPAVRATVPISLGAGPVEYGQRRRDVYVVGATAEYARLRDLTVARGSFLPGGDPRAGASVAVLGSRLARELFGAGDPVGAVVRVARARFRVIGVLAPKGQSLGVDIDDLVFVPVARGMRLFHHTSLDHVLVQAAGPASIAAAQRQVREVLTDRHRGEDVTVVTQQAMLDSFAAVIGALTAALAGIAAISLAVAGIGIMNVMLVAVSERTAEIGVLKALGARDATVSRLFVTEAALLSAIGAVAGVVAGTAAVVIAARAFPQVPLRPSALWIGIVLALGLGAGTLFGWMPARRAAALPPVEALRGRR